MFLAGDKLGRPRTMDGAWDYLSKKYDMTVESPATIHQTLLDWAADLQADALEKLKIDGLLVKMRKMRFNLPLDFPKS